MIDLDTLAICQKDGLEAIKGLTDPEKELIDSICAYLCPQIIEQVRKNKEPLEKAVNDAFLYGLALGTKIDIRAGGMWKR
jgi:hypothetical protein